MSTKTILYIEDSPLNIRLVERFLKPYNCKVIGEYYASSGIKRAIVERPDLIFIDIFLPDSNGFTVYNKLRNRDETCNIPMFAMTADDSDQIRFRCKEAGFQEFLNKPFSRDALVMAIQKHIILDATPILG